MGSSRRRYSRSTGTRAYRKLFIVAVEGARTEPIYFSFFNKNAATITIKCLKGNGASSPPDVRRRIDLHLNRNTLRTGDEAWIVIDKDDWTDDQIHDAHDWSLTSPAYGLALSNPKFEYWLLLHFEDATNVTSSQSCDARIRRYLPDYDKGFDLRKLTANAILDAIERAKRRDTPTCADWPRKPGVTTAYVLVERLALAAGLHRSGTQPTPRQRSGEDRSPNRKK